jgi:hypothetical protein
MGNPGVIEASGGETPPALLPIEIKFDYSAEVVERANERVRYGTSGKSGRLTGIAGLIMAMFFVGYVLTGGNWGALMGFLGGCVFLIVAGIAAVRAGRRKIARTPSDTMRTVSIAADGMTFRSSGQVFSAEWSNFRELRVFPDFLVFYVYNQVDPRAVPVGALGDDLKKVIETGIREHGGKVIGPKPPLGCITKAVRGIIVLLGMIVMAGLAFHSAGHRPGSENSFDRMRMNDLVAQVRNIPFQGTAEFHWREVWHKNVETDTVNEVQWGGFTSPKIITGADAAGYQVWAERGNDQKLKVVIATGYGEAGGAEGFAYSDTPLKPVAEAGGHFRLALPGPVGIPLREIPLEDRWWEVFESESGGKTGWDGDDVTVWKWSRTWKLP